MGQAPKVLVSEVMHRIVTATIRIADYVWFFSSALADS